MMTRQEVFDAVAATILAATLSAFWVATHRDVIYEDSPEYLIAAENLAEGRGFLSVPSPNTPPAWRFERRKATFRLDDLQGEVEATRTPGYPLFLAPLRLLGLTPRQVTFVQHALRALLIGAVTLFARRLGASRGAALATALWLLIEPYGRWAANHIMTETLFALVVFAIVWITADALAQRRMSFARAATIGILCGVATLIRPIALAYFVAVLVCTVLFNRQRRWATAALLIVAALALPLAWSWRNASRTGMFTVSLIIPINKLFYRAAGAEAATMPGDFIENLQRLQQLYRGRVDAAIAAREHALRRTLTAPEKLEIFDATANDVVRRHPLGVLRRAAADFRMVMLPVLRCDSCGTLRNRAKDALLLAHLAFAVLAIAGAVAITRREVAVGTFLILTIGYFVMIGAGDGASWGRFRVPIEPYYALCAAVGGTELVRRVRKRVLS